MAKVHFFSELPSFKIQNPRKTSKWVESICSLEKRSLESLTYIFCSDRALRSMNKKYLNHLTYTDILTFDLSETRRISGEIYISVDRVKDNGKHFGQTFEHELRRVIAHGVLHLIGYSDKTPSEKSQMRSKEEAYLSLWK
jgi:probable rRNA maturation factor